MNSTGSMIQRAVIEAAKMKFYNEINNQCIQILTKVASNYGFDMPEFLKTDAGQFLLRGGTPLLFHWVAENRPEFFEFVIGKGNAKYILEACRCAFTTEVFREFNKLMSKLMTGKLSEHVAKLVSLGKQVSEAADTEDESGDMSMEKIFNLQKDASSLNKSL